MKADQQSIEKQQLSEGMKKCPFCAEMIKQDAKVCVGIPVVIWLCKKHCDV